MGGLLKDWIESTMKHELNEGLEWLGRKAPKSLETTSSSFEDDGSNLRIKVARAGIVQIVKYTAFEKQEPIQAEITDSLARMKATFAASAVRRFNSGEKRGITLDTLGRLIEILDFEIVATHIGPKNSRLTMLIKDFRLIGEGGSGRINNIPRPIEVVESILDLLNKLQSFRQKESSICQKLKEQSHKARSPLIKPLDESTLSNEETWEADYDGFATQIPCSRHKGQALVNGKKHSNTSLHTGLDDFSNEGFNGKTRNEKLLESAPGSLKESSNLQNLKSGVCLQSSRNYHAVPPRAVVNGKKNLKAHELLSLLPDDSTPKSALPSKFVAISPRPIGAGVTQNPTDFGEVPEANVAETENQPEASVVGVSTPSLQDTEPAKPVKIVSLIDSDVLHASLAPALNKTEVIKFSRPFGRIKRREVKILSEQKSLLERPDCWIPAETGQREPGANLPIKILQTISECADKRQRQISMTSTSVDRSQNKLEPDASQATTERETNSNEDSDLDVPIPSAEWPPSSPPQKPYEQLPPDSSAQIPTRANSFQEDELRIDRPMLKRRKLSSSSATSNSVTPSRKGSVRRSDASKSSIESSALSISESSEKGSGLFNRSVRARNTSDLKPQGLDCLPKRNASNKNLNDDDSDASKSQASIISGSVCTRCHQRFDWPRDLVQHEKNSRCATDSSQILRNFDDPRSSPIFAKTHEARIQISQEKVQELPQQGTILQLTKNQTETREHPITLNSSVAQPEDYLNDMREGSNRDSTIGCNNLSEQGPSANPNSANVGDIGHSTLSISNVKNASPNLENSVLEVYAESKNLQSSNEATQHFPSTAQLQEPVLQVERTPFLKGHVADVTLTGQISQLSFPKQKSDNLKPKINVANGYQTSTKPVILQIPCDEASSLKSRDYRDSRAKPSHTGLESPQSMDLDLIDQQVQDEINAQHGAAFINPVDQKDDKDDEIVLIRCSMSESISNTESCDIVNEGTRLPTTSEQESTYTDFRKSDLLLSEKNSKTVKHKLPETAADSPNVNKRRKRAKSRFSFDFSQDLHQVVDPSVLGTRNRQDFFNSRKGSMVNAEKEIPDASLRVISSSLDSYAHTNNDKKLTGTSEPDDVSVSQKTSSLKPQNAGKLEVCGDDSRVETQYHEAMLSDVTPTETMPYIEEQVVQNSGQLDADNFSDVLMADGVVHDDVMVQAQNKPMTITKVESSANFSNIFDRFHIAYPNYTATLEQFLAICKKIKRLFEADRMEHQSLWDDFIIRHKTEYPNFLRRCADQAEDPVPYEKFYRNEIDEPQFVSRIITPKTLHEAVSLGAELDRNTSQLKHRRPDEAQKAAIVLQSHEARKVENESPCSAKENRSSSQAVIDLTRDDKVIKIEKEQEPSFVSNQKSPYSLPWPNLQGNDSDDNTKGIDSLKSPSKPLSLVELSHTATPGFAKISKSLDSSSTINTPIKKVNEYNAHLEDSDANVAQALSKSILQTGPQPADGPHLDIVRETPLKKGVTSDDMVFNRSVEKVPLTTRKHARNERSHKNRSSSLSLEKLASTGLGQKITGMPWWKDHYTPFINFARAYTTIQSGNGNSFAAAKSTQSEIIGKPPTVGTFPPHLKRIDVSKWQI